MEVERFDEDLVIIYLIPSYFSRNVESIRRREARYRGNSNGNQIKNGAIQDRQLIIKGETLYIWNARW